MARDYAKYKVKPEKQLPEKGWGMRLLLAVLALSVMAGLVAGIYFYKTHEVEFSQQKWSTWAAEIKSLLRHKKVSGVNLQKTQPVQQAKQEPEVRFNFYTELPNMQVTLPETEQVPEKQALINRHELITAVTKGGPLKEFNGNKAEAEKRGQYILQVGVFKNETAAGQMRVSLLLAGFEMDVVKNTVENKTVYRIQKGPYGTQAEAKEEQQKLLKKGIVGVVKKL